MILRAAEATVGVVVGLVGIAAVLFAVVLFCLVCWRIEVFFKE